MLTGVKEAGVHEPVSERVPSRGGRRISRMAWRDMKGLRSRWFEEIPSAPGGLR